MDDTTHKRLEQCKKALSSSLLSHLTDEHRAAILEIVEAGAKAADVDDLGEYFLELLAPKGRALNYTEMSVYSCGMRTRQAWQLCHDKALKKLSKRAKKLRREAN